MTDEPLPGTGWQRQALQRSKPSGESLVRVFAVELLEVLIHRSGQSFQESRMRHGGLFNVQSVTRGIAPDRREREEIELHRGLTRCLPNGGHDLRFGQFFTRDIRDAGSLVEKLQQRCRPLKPTAAHHVADVVAIQSRDRRQQNVVVASLQQFVCFEHGRLQRVVFLFGNELEEVRSDVEQPDRTAIRERNGHPAFAGREAVITHGDIAVVSAHRVQISRRTASRPHGGQTESRPEMLRQQMAVCGGTHSFEFECSYPVRSANATPQRRSSLVGNIHSL